MGPIIVVAGIGGTALGGWIAQGWSKKTAKALYLVPALSALLAVPPAMLCFFGPTKLIVPSLRVAVFLVFLGTGPVNAATLNAVPANLRATAMAGQLFALHVFGDIFSPEMIGVVSDHSNLRLGLGLTLVTFVMARGSSFWERVCATDDDSPEGAADCNWHGMHLQCWSSGAATRRAAWLVAVAWVFRANDVVQRMPTLPD